MSRTAPALTVREVRTRAYREMRELHPTWAKELVTGLIRHPHRCAPTADEYQRITDLPHTTTRLLWSAA